LDIAFRNTRLSSTIRILLWLMVTVWLFGRDPIAGAR
jgi:hypothetical protein